MRAQRHMLNVGEPHPFLCWRLVTEMTVLGGGACRRGCTRDKLSGTGLESNRKKSLRAGVKAKHLRALNHWHLMKGTHIVDTEN